MATCDLGVRMVRTAWLSAAVPGIVAMPDASFVVPLVHATWADSAMASCCLSKQHTQLTVLSSSWLQLKAPMATASGQALTSTSSSFSSDNIRYCEKRTIYTCLSVPALLLSCCACVAFACCCCTVAGLVASCAAAAQLPLCMLYQGATRHCCCSAGSASEQPCMLSLLESRCSWAIAVKAGAMHSSASSTAAGPMGGMCHK